MTKSEVKKRIEVLKKVIIRNRYLYHVLDRQEISDSALDSLKKELFDLEQQFPEFITLDSPTQRVGGKPLAKFEKYRHSVPMISLNDAFSEQDMEDWLKRNLRLLSSGDRQEVDYFAELKIDGLAIELVYENGILKTGSTRGDGIIGEDVTQNLKTIEAIPLKLREIDEIVKELKSIGLKECADKISKETVREIIVRGEVFIPKKEFERVNKEQGNQGLPIFANPRNMAAGSVRQLDPKITSSRRLDSFAYELISDFGQKTHQEKHQILKALGLKINPHNRYCKDLKEVFAFHERSQKIRSELHYEIDGIVVMVNDNKIFDKLGVVGKAPRGAIAYKFPLKQSTTIVESISVHVGRTGAVTPVAHLKPVQVGGVVISNATLHNEDEIKRLGLKIGDTVVVGRAGDVIPAIIKVLPELRTGKEKDFSMPKFCPSCGTKLVKLEGEVIWRCNNPLCIAKKREYFYHFVSRSAFDIRGLGPKIIDRFFDEGLISDPADIFKLTESDIIPLERFAEKSAKNLIESINSRKSIIFPRFIYGLGIRNVGEETAQDLSKRFKSISELKNASFEGLQRVLGIGPVVAESIHEWFQDKRNRYFLNKLEKVGIKIHYLKVSAGNQKLAGKVFVLTGSLETMERNQAKEKIVSLGGGVSESVSKKTDYVIVGKEPGLKLEKAKNLGVKIMNEKDFLNIIK